MDGRNVKSRVNHIFESVTVKESEAVYINRQDILKLSGISWNQRRKKCIRELVTNSKKASRQGSPINKIKVEYGTARHGNSGRRKIYEKMREGKNFVRLRPLGSRSSQMRRFHRKMGPNSRLTPPGNSLRNERQQIGLSVETDDWIQHAWVQEGQVRYV